MNKSLSLRKEKVFIMNDTNEEVFQKINQTICDYYMGHIKQKLNSLLQNGKENEISNQIKQFLDSQIYSGNFSINRDDIVRILDSVLLEDYSDSFNSELEQTRISYSLPNVATIDIDKRWSSISY